jgi:trehalose 6-phosphate phosphatase
MEYLFDHLDTVRKKIQGKAIFLFLDFDGTLCPIVEDPAEACLSQMGIETLQRLAKKDTVKVAIISGRKLSDIKSKVPVDDFIYSGNHGLEIEGHGIHYNHPVPGAYYDEIQNLGKILHDAFARFKGVIIENKELSLSIHFRMAEEGRLEEIHKIIAANNVNGLLQVRNDKKTCEIMPDLQWDKGKAVLNILDHYSQQHDLVPVYIGDALTDEDAFKALKKDGITIRVGPSQSSAAEYYLQNIEDVYRFIDVLII